MATRIRTLNFLPDVFKTQTNTQFLSATLDQIVDQPNTMKIEGYVGSKFGYGINAKDKYVVEPTKVRQDYQLDPGVVFLKQNTDTSQDFISYPGILDALKVEGGLTNNNGRLFKSQFYSWDSFTNLDKIINFNQYYWLPDGPEAVTIETDSVYNSAEYIITDLSAGYSISEQQQPIGSTNPTLTLLRGGTYTFSVNQPSQFWIQGEPGLTGYDPAQPNVQTRDVLGVVNNGATSGIVTFNVPQKDAQDQYNFPGNNTVGVISTLPFDQVNGVRLSQLKNIDGVTTLENLTVMFYNTGVVDEEGYVSKFYDTTLYDQDGGASYTYPGDDTDYNNFEGGFYTDVPATFYKIVYEGDPTDPVIQLIPVGLIPTNEKIVPQYGTQWVGRTFYRNVQGTVSVVPYLSASKDVLYYQDGTSANKVGQIRLIENNVTNRIDVLTDILGKINYTAPNGVVFTNGLKVIFQGDIYPASYKNVEYYVEGVGTAIELIAVNDLIAPQSFTQAVYSPYDVLPYDIGNYDSSLYVPVTPDYITIARNSIDRNAWSRSNRWFHIDVINATATYNNNPALATIYATSDRKARRPIIEFYPNLKLFDSGIVGKKPVDYIDFRTTDAFSQVAGKENFYPDVQTYTSYSASVTGVTAQTSTVIILPSSSITGQFTVGQYVADSDNLLPDNAQITDISSVSGITTLTVEWAGPATFATGVNLSIAADDSQLNEFSLFDGARIIFAADTDEDIKNKIFVVRFSTITPNSTPVITLSLADDGNISFNEQVAVLRGYSAKGKDYYYHPIYDINTELYTNGWEPTQQKNTVNQPPLFDVFDAQGYSFGDKDRYDSSSFTGCKLFAYGIGTGLSDSVLGFPIRYSSITNSGDISFDVSLNIDTFNYVTNGEPITLDVNTGYVYNYSDLNTYGRAIGWQTAAGPSVQYQIFEFNYDSTNPTSIYTCDIAAVDQSTIAWPNVQLFVNNVRQPANSFIVDIQTNKTVVNFTVPDPSISTVVEILVLSDQVSSTAYYQVPWNLSNNPFNTDVQKLNMGDLRNQYQSIFYNVPSITGQVFGSNNYRDSGNLVPYGTAIIQNSASLVLPATFLRKQNHSLFNALLFNSKEYVNFKTLLINTVDNTEYSVYNTPAFMLDDALDQMTASKTEIDSFFWSDMVPSKAPYASNTYSFANSLDVSVYPLTKVYDFSKANYNGVVVYLVRNNQTTQLIRGVDYTISTDSPALTVTLDLLPGDRITINEYNQTYGSYVPNTPTKLGLYPSTIPEVVLDNAYSVPTYFILGHDGSYNKLYGAYDPNTGKLEDFRDQVLLEFEKRVYNNLKLSNTVPLREYDVIPGFFRETGYSYNEFIQMYSEGFLNWIGQNRIEYKTQYYNPNNEYSFNYNQSGNKINQQPIPQGYWRGIYQYFYDTSRPDTAPWELLGFTEQPTWWETRYGPAPYTSDNTVLWGDLAAGISWNNGNPVVIEQCIRPELLKVLPVDSNGDLVSPFVSVLGNYYNQSFKRDWVVGDVGPAEFSYRRSSAWPFDLMRLLALSRPAEFFNLGVDVDNYKYNEEFNQYLVNDRSHLVISDVEIYGNGTPKTSYINWIVDYEKQVGVDATSNIETLLDNLDVRLVYRLAGFSDKTLLKFYVEKGTVNGTNSSLLIPDESYSVLLYDNQPFEKIVYSSVIIQSTQNGTFKVFGNSQTNAYFKVFAPKINGNYESISLFNLTVQVANNYYDNPIVVPYGAEFYTIQEVAQFLEGYSRYLESLGVKFQEQENGIPVTWRQMVVEFMYWAQSGWETGSIINLNPAANRLMIQKDSQIIQPLTLQRQNFILNQNLYPIQLVDMNVVREDTAFAVNPLNSGDTVAYGQFYASNFEHGIVFNNVTLFDDVIYNLITGLRQNRIIVRGTKSAEWNGTITAGGFVLNQDNVVEWDNTVKYTKGAIVKYKNKYWTALKIIQPASVFQEKDWKETDYNDIQKGMLPNTSTRAYEATLYYDVNRANLEQDADLLGFSLIGYRPRDYMALADLTDITQINVYKNLIKNKGTLNSVNVFRGAQLPQGGIKYDVYENWAIKAGEYGGVLNTNFIEFGLNENLLTGNPAIVGLTNGTSSEGVQQEVPLYSLVNYGRSVNDTNVLETLPIDTPNQLFPSAGYANFNDMKISSFYYSGLATAKVPLDKLFVGDYVWLATYKGSWQVMAPTPITTISSVINNNNGTATIVFDGTHGLKKYDAVAIINFDSQVNGYYTVSDIASPTRIVVPLTLLPGSRIITGAGVGLKFQVQRVAKPNEINNLPLLDKEFSQNKVWVDEANNGSWAVLRKSLNYKFSSTLTEDGSVNYGSAVAYTQDSGYIVSDSSKGEIYRYTYDPLLKRYVKFQTLVGGTSYGSAIEHKDDLFVISQPTGATAEDRKIYIYRLVNDTERNEFVSVQEPIVAPNASVTSWGETVAISGDQSWIFVSDTANNNVYVYEKSNVTGTYGLSSVLSLPTLNSGDNFGKSLSTNYYGNTLVVGAPNQNFTDSNINDSGYAYVFDRLYQTFEAKYTSQPFVPQTFDLLLTPTTQITAITATTATGNVITTNTTSGLRVYDPVIFSGTSFGAIAENIVYYVSKIIDGTKFTIASQQYAGNATRTESITNKITVDSTDNLIVNRPITFTGYVGSSGIQNNVVYYVKSITTDIDGNPAITISETAGGSVFAVTSAEINSAFVTLDADVVLVTATGTMNAVAQTQPMTLIVNGTLLSNNEYAVNGNTLYVYKNLTAGDMLEISSNNFVLAQVLQSEQEPQIGAQYGTGNDMNIYGTELLIGAPYEITNQNTEGSVYRYTNSAAKYGTVKGSSACVLSSPATILINGYAVNLPAGDASDVADAINNANLMNITASNESGILSISLIDVSLAKINDKLTVSAFDTFVLTQLGISQYALTQTINCPHTEGKNQFGTKVKFNTKGSVVITAPVGTRYAATTFDFIDESNYNNDTLFDNNTTTWIDSYPNAGAVYMYDYLPTYNESITNIGNFVYAQSTNSLSQEFGNQPYYGFSVDFNDNVVIVGSPNYLPESIKGQAVVYANPVGVQDWTVYRYPSERVDVSKIQNVQLYSASTNNTLLNLDYIDPLQGKILGSVRQNIDYVSSTDPAGYNAASSTDSGVIAWGPQQVGQIWLDTSTFKFVDYHQNDTTYNSKWWGRVFPGSDVSAYTWIASNVPPIDYVGPGAPLSTSQYAIQYFPTATQSALTAVFYFWVRNSNVLFSNLGKTMTDTVIQSYVADPFASGISYFAPLLSNVYGLYNCASEINALDTILHIGFGNGNNDDITHSSYSLIRANYADDFLPGLPLSTRTSMHDTTGTISVAETVDPTSLYKRMLESLSGVDDAGNVVPDPYLPKLVQSGILARPRQSFFYNRFKALQNYLEFTNTILKQYPITETTNTPFLFKVGEINPTTGKPFYDTSAYWEYADWWAEGYNSNVRAALQVPAYSDLSTLSVPASTIVTVSANSNGKSETYVLSALGIWTRIGLQNGTIQFKSSLWDYQTPRLGFGDNFFDTTPYDEYPSEETKYIIRSINEEIFVDQPLFRNKALILLFEYIQSETIENQNYLPWLNKTSLVDVAHTIRNLEPLQVYQSDNQDFLAGYINEVKPYHVVVKDFLFKYTGEEIYTGDISDFDLPAQYDSQTESFISPQLVYTGVSSDSEFLPSSSVWQNPEYTQWYQNYGLSIVGQNNYPITTLASYVELNSSSMLVDNPYGFPVNGVLTLGTERIAYSGVDQSTNTIFGLTRGVDDTEISVHLPGEQIFVDLPPVLLLDSGRGYINPPRVTAYIDTTLYPAPRRPAILKANMFLDTILNIEVIDPGSGYAVLPEIRIEPSASVTVNPTNVIIRTSSMIVESPTLQTGDLVRYVSASEDTAIGGLLNGEYYYVNALESTPSYIIALYTNYADAIADKNRVVLYSTGSGNQNQLQLTARASCVSSALPVRENQITLRFDRTTYSSQVTDWKPAGFYGSFYAGLYNNSESISSSAISLQSTQPPISSILASAQGAAFEIANVYNNTSIDWSSLVRNITTINQVNDVLTLTPAAPTVNASQSTIGFYVGMPVKFAGAVSGNIVIGTTYYVTEVIDDVSFKINLSMAGTTVLPGGLTMYVGKINDIAMVDINYPGILTATNTYSNTNVIKTPLTLTGQGGTTNFYVGLPIYFTGDVFGKVVDNQTYYVTTIIDKEHFTMSLTNDPLTITIVSTDGITDIVTVDIEENTIGLSVNDPVIFNSMVVAGTSVNSFGNIVSGTTYYIQEVLSPTTFRISSVINGGVFNLSTVSAAANTRCTVTSQVDTAQLETGTGAMNLIAGLPVSPGQITGQQFTLYPTSDEYVNNVGTNGNLLSRTISYTIGTPFVTPVNRVLLADKSFPIDNIYVNLPLRVAQNIGGLVAGTTYYVIDKGITEVEVTSTASIVNADVTGSITDDVLTVTAVATGTIVNGSLLTGTGVAANTQNIDQMLPLLPGESLGGIGRYVVTQSQTVSSTNIIASTGTLTCNNASLIYENMSIVFSGTSLGGADLDREYFVANIINATTFQIKDAVVNGKYVVLSNDNGSMTGSGDAYLKLSTTKNGSAVSLSTPSVTGVTIQQYIAPANNAIFDVSYILGGYRVIIADSGEGYAIDNTVVISGTNLGGATPRNDLTITVNGIDTDGGITSAICSGKPAEIATKYYFKVVSQNTFEVYYNSLMTVPVPSTEFLFSGIRSSEVTEINSSGNITVQNATYFDVNDPVVFTGNIVGNLTLGNTYYVLTKIGNVITVSETIGGTVFNPGTSTGVSFTVAKSGDYAFLPEPFYFNQSIVRYNDRVYQCVISNNDDEFIIGKWEELRSEDRELNALDRIMGYYKPAKSNEFAWNEYLSMPGLDLTQLVSGITYPNPTYRGNAFAPEDQEAIDTILQDQAFYPTEIDSLAVVFDGTKYIAVSNTPNYTGIITATNSNFWEIQKITDSPVNSTDIVFNGNKYIVTTNNPVTPLFVSDDGIIWTTSVNYVGTAGYNTLNSITYSNGLHFAAGERILISSDAQNWFTSYEFYNGLENMLYGIEYINASNFVGIIAVGRGQTIIGGNLTDVNLLLTSLNDGATWLSPATTLTSNALRSVATDGTTIVVVGDAGEIFTSINGSTWAPSVSGVSDNLYKVIYCDFISKFIVVGQNGVILTSGDGSTWVQESSNTTEDLFGITTNESYEIVIVGNNNTVITSYMGMSWPSISAFIQEPTVYTVQGSAFTDGYGPEELVPGVVSDNLFMIVKTRPGTTWDATQYAHVGFNVVSTELTPTTQYQTVYSFKNAVENPAEVALFIVDPLTNLSTSIYENVDYTVNWVEQTVTLNNPLDYFPVPQQLRIDAYEVGNGDQLVRSNTQSNALIENVNSGFYEIELDCNYSKPSYEGSGAIRPGTENKVTTSTDTYAASDAILCNDVSIFVVNNPVTFQGDVLGGLVADTIYYVKTIGYGSNTITVSDTIVGGVAGPTFPLTDDSGSMLVEVQVGSGEVWAEPVVLHNGQLLERGDTYTITQTVSATNTIVCDSTSALVAGMPVVFCNRAIGELIPGQQYTVLAVIDLNEFQVEDPSNPGNPLPLTDEVGGCLGVTNDFAFGLSANGITAKIIFTAQYDTTVDYISYTVFGETAPEQYGYTLPIPYQIVADGSATYVLTQYVEGDNPTSAIVEVNGLRIQPSLYSINPNTQELTFVTPPTAGDLIVVTAYNFTERQYLVTQELTITDGSVLGEPNNTVTQIVNVDNTIVAPIASTTVTAVNGTTITCLDTSGFVVDQTIIFETVSGPGLGNINVDGTVYFVQNIINGTEFSISETLGGSAFDAGVDTGIMSAIIGGQPAVRVTTGSVHSFQTNDLIRIDGVQGSIQLNNNTYYAHVIDDLRFDLYETPYQSGVTDVNNPITQVSNYVSGGYAWVNNSFVLKLTTGTETISANNLISVADTSGLVFNTPVIFTGDVGSSGLVENQVYYVKDIDLISPNTFTVSATREGAAVVLSDASGLDFNVTQWEQTNVDRLWVTVNGYRVPSSALFLNNANYLSILMPLAAGDVVVITSMIPSATPNQETYIQVVNKNQEQTVYRANDQTRTWLLEPLLDTSNVIWVDDVTKLVDTYTTSAVVPMDYDPYDNPLEIGLAVDKNIISKVIVYNNTTGSEIFNVNYEVELQDLAPVLVVYGSIQPGDDITVTVLLGNMIYINGEQIKFTTVNTQLNALTGLQRGMNGTGIQKFSDTYTEVYSLLSTNRMAAVLYDQTWNSDVYNPVLGDPLQISETVAATFLNADIG